MMVVLNKDVAVDDHLDYLTVIVFYDNSVKLLVMEKKNFHGRYKNLVHNHNRLGLKHPNKVTIKSFNRH